VGKETIYINLFNTIKYHVSLKGISALSNKQKYAINGIRGSINLTA